MPPLSEFFTFAAVGAFAQLVDGALGMAYGVVSAAMLLGLGLPPAAASASVHYAETFTCGASGLSHLAAGNVRRQLFWTLAIPGVIGAVIGAYVVTHVPANWMRLALTPYMLGMGVFLLRRATRGDRPHDDAVPRATRPLGLVAGFADAVAGGGWSALTVTTLVARGATPRTVIGTVHLAKSVVSAAASVSFLLHVGATNGVAVLGLIVGGVTAAPLGALLARRMPARAATLLAATAVLALGLNNVVKALH
ncbi:sulfite exporter TauE/SafE family protein [Rhodanobacter denitrificans]|uniref:Probable membrane transporter protein n=1 Tax=Rhodanobacter denitrificans TaxID=666685 RepID=A0A368KG46_9GAMM|nr:sulfite exporter TauE/SafE family protein [Rhodanobacter denitrificans]RCS30096.1 sulfite exporter TauE/SafE family protein [Rhodanobacter denitrificans]